MNEDQNENKKEVTHEETQTGDAPTGKRPTMKFSGSGGLVVSVWKSKTQGGFDSYSVSIDRNYRRDDGTFEAAKSLRDSDLLRTQQLLGMADAWIEHDKAKGRGASASTKTEPLER